MGMSALLFPPGLATLGLISAGPLAGSMVGLANAACMESYRLLTLWPTVPEPLQSTRAYCPESFWLTSYRSSVPVLSACLLLLLPLAAGTHLLISRAGSDEQGIKTSAMQSRTHGAARLSTSTSTSQPPASTDLGVSSLNARSDPWLRAARLIVVGTVLREEKRDQQDQHADEAEKGVRSTTSSYGSIPMRSTAGKQQDLPCCQSEPGTFSCSMLCSVVWIGVATAFVMAYPAIARAAFLYSRTCTGPICVLGVNNWSDPKFHYCAYCAIAID